MDNRTENKKNGKKNIIIAIIVCIMIATAAVIIISVNPDNENDGHTDDGSQSESIQETLEAQTNNDGEEIASALTVPDPTSLDVEEIVGYGAKTSQITLNTSDIEIKSVGVYSGTFIEDGSDEAVANVAALIVTNKSDRMLQIGIIEFQVNESETATFQISNLPAGTSVLVMEQNCREYDEEDDYSYGEASTGFTEQNLYEDMFSVSGEDGELTLTNNTDTTYSTVYVYYKYIQSGGAYLGGITYRTPFENVEPGDTVNAVANHYTESSSVITLVTYAE